jgi:hypothetical protein
MNRIIDGTQIAILYETITGQCQKRGSIGIDGDDTLNLDAFLDRHHGLAAVVVSRTLHPGPDDNEHFCRQAIADVTGTPYFHRGADRAVAIRHPPAGRQRVRPAQLTLSDPLHGEQLTADRVVSAEQFYARIAPNNAMRLSRIDWL